MSLISKAQVQRRFNKSKLTIPIETSFSTILGLLRCKNLWYLFFVSLALSGVWLLFNGLLALLFSLFYVIREFDRFLH